ncbi:MAG: hypothetical protein ACJA16_000424, partial [Akkermansiaceae bacterium]
PRLLFVWWMEPLLGVSVEVLFFYSDPWPFDSAGDGASPP